MNAEYYMNEALMLAQKAFLQDEVPVGALVVYDGQIIGRAYNKKEQKNLPTAHAEILAIEQACKSLGTWRLNNATVFTTLEPCVMCAGALVHARIKHLVYGASDKKFGCIKSLYELGNDSRFNHNFTHESGVLKNECAQLLKDFFALRRKNN